MKHQVNTLDGALLDMAVAIVEGLQYTWHAKVGPSGDDWLTVVDTEMADQPDVPFVPSRSGCDAQPIIERERISVWQYDWPDLDVANPWRALVGGVHGYSDESIGAGPDLTRDPVLGPTFLVAAMRAYLTSKVGEEIDLTPSPS